MKDDFIVCANYNVPALGIMNNEGEWILSYRQESAITFIQEYGTLYHNCFICGVELSTPFSLRISIKVPVSRIPNNEQPKISHKMTTPKT